MIARPSPSNNPEAWPDLAQVQRPPRVPRLPLSWRGETVGSITPELAATVALALRDGSHIKLLIQEHESHVGCALQAHGVENLSDALLPVVQVLKACGRSGPWRNELVPVANVAGNTVALVERGVVRVLGLCTQAVHLVGRRHDGAIWVQQRSLTKPNDPGLWDTLMGGTVAGSETVEDTLARETWEEAGLHLTDLTDVAHRGHFTATRPVPDGGNEGYLVENTHWYTATVSQGSVPVNQDGEVDHFECWSEAQVRHAVEKGLFTPEAAWVLMRVLNAQGH